MAAKRTREVTRFGVYLGRPRVTRESLPFRDRIRRGRTVPLTIRPMASSITNSGASNHSRDNGIAETVLDFDDESRQTEDPLNEVLDPCSVEVEELVQSDDLRIGP